jgi:hypothetical protein
MEGIIEFVNEMGSRYGFNKMFFHESYELAPQVTVPRERLEYWENVLFTELAPAVCKSFYVRKRYHAIEGSFTDEFEMLTEAWSGTLSLHSVEDDQTTKLDEICIQAEQNEINKII